LKLGALYTRTCPTVLGPSPLRNTNTRLPFLVVVFVPFRIISFRLGLYAVSRISAIAGSAAGNDILESLVGRSASVPKFQECSENEALVTVISFAKTRMNYTEPNQANMLGGRQYPFISGQ
jgi:hypothetical protein